MRQKGKSTATYYVPGEAFPKKTLHGDESTMQDNGSAMQDNGPAMQDNGPSVAMTGCPENITKCKAENRFLCAAFQTLPDDLQDHLRRLKRRTRPGALEDLIYRVCTVRNTSRAELVCFLGRNETYIRGILNGMLKKKRLAYVIPEMPKHPKQSYRATNHIES